MRDKDIHLLMFVCAQIVGLHNVGAGYLDCSDFDANCGWHNSPSATIMWFRSSANITADEMMMTTGTGALPKSSYAIATSISANASLFAHLLSDVLPCQNGNGSLVFNYWTSPFVLLDVCTKLEGVPLNRTASCQSGPLSQGPGPATIPIPAIPTPFRIVIEAANFVYANGLLTGGFAILDNVLYTGDYCANAAAANKTSGAAGNGSSSAGGNSTTVGANSTAASGANATSATANATASPMPTNATSANNATTTAPIAVTPAPSNGTAATAGTTISNATTLMASAGTNATSAVTTPSQAVVTNPAPVATSAPPASTASVSTAGTTSAPPIASSGSAANTTTAPAAVATATQVAGTTVPSAVTTTPTAAVTTPAPNSTSATAALTTSSVPTGAATAPTAANNNSTALNSTAPGK